MFRSTYLGYRREDRPDREAGARTQVYASLVPRQRELHVVLPVDPNAYAEATNVRNIGMKGHHGIGAALVVMRSADDLSEFLIRFDSWLRTRVP